MSLDNGDFWDSVPDYFNDWSDNDKLSYWSDFFGQYTPDDWYQTLGEYMSDHDGSNIRGTVFADPIDAAEYLYGTGAFPYAEIIYDEGTGLYYIAVDYEEE
jgi:hypothetical protein